MNTFDKIPPGRVEELTEPTCKAYRFTVDDLVRIEGEFKQRVQAKGWLQKPNKIGTHRQRKDLTQNLQRMLEGVCADLCPDGHPQPSVVVSFLKSGPRMDFEWFGVQI